MARSDRIRDNVGSNAFFILSTVEFFEFNNNFVAIVFFELCPMLLTCVS